VIAWIDLANGTVTGRRDYGAFGEPLVATGNATGFPFAFSTKYRDSETELYYYGFRYYNPSTGRWLSRDPINEEGGLNLYAFVSNDPVDAVDILGLSIIDQIASIPSSAGSFINSAIGSAKGAVSAQLRAEASELARQYLKRPAGSYTHQGPRFVKDYGPLQLYAGIHYRIRVEGCEVQLEGGGFGGGRLKSIPIGFLAGGKLVGGITFSATTRYRITASQYEEWGVAASITLNAGVRWEFQQVWLGTGLKLFAEVGATGSWSWDLSTLEYTGFRSGVYARGVAEVVVSGSVRRRHEFRFTWGDAGIIGD
jgi:RHS repeat-associated protein